MAKSEILQIFMILNTRAHGFRKIKDYLEKRKIQYHLKKEEDQDLVNKLVQEGHRDFILGGGDGTINQFIHTYMQLPQKKKRE